MNSRFLLYFLLIISFLSCKVDNKQDIKKDDNSVEFSYNQLESKLVDEFSKALPDEVSAMDIYWSHDNNELHHTDYPLTTIYSFNTDEKAWGKSIFFKKEGPNGIGLGTGYYYQNKDSIYLFNGYKHLMYLLNSKGKKLETFNLPEDFTVNLFTTRKVKKYKNSLLIPGSEYLKVDNSYTEKAHLLVKYNFLDKTYDKIINYPNNYKNKIWKKEQLMFTFDIVEKNIIGSFPVSPELHLYDLDGNIQKTVQAQSKYVEKATPIGKLDPNSPKANKIYYENGYYTYVLWDSYRKVFYRLAYYLPKGVEGKKEYKLRDMNLSVILLNDDMGYIGEAQLPNDISGYQCFVDERGLNLSIKPNYIEADHEVRAFKTFKFK